MRSISVVPAALLFLIALPQGVRSQDPGTADTLQKEAVKAYIDCSSCDYDYLRTEVTFVNYVRDRAEADLHVLVTTQTTASGGTEHTITLIGQGRFAGASDTLLYISRQSETQDEVRAGLVRVLKAGLLRYALKTPLRDFLTVQYTRPSVAGPVTDKWDYWVFRISLNGFLDGEQQTTNKSLGASVSANRVTEDWKVNLSARTRYSDRRFDFEDAIVKDIQRSQYVEGLLVRSLDDHWSVGLSGWLESSSYNNTRLVYRMAPALEYDLFPYSHSTREQLRFMYRLGVNRASYQDSTIFDKIAETYVSQSLDIALELKQPWGSISASLEGVHYPWDRRTEGKPLGQRISWNIFGMISWKVFEGFSIDMFGGYSSIHDQFSLRKGEASRDDVLLQRTRLATNYSYNMAFGVSYTFGSIFNNIVNPRMGGGGGSSMTISF